jgi:hypothetical protein
MGFVSKRLVSLRSWGSLGVSEVKGLLARAASRSRARDAESSGLAGMRAFGLKTPMARELGVQKVFGLDVSRALLLAASKVLFGALVTELTELEVFWSSDRRRQRLWMDAMRVFGLNSWNSEARGVGGLEIDFQELRAFRFWSSC